MNIFYAPSQINDRGLTTGLILLPLIWLCGGQLVILPYHGGSGLAFPQNLLAWAAIATLALWCVFTMPVKTKAIVPSQLMLLGGVVLWSLPLIWTPSTDWFNNAAPRVVALWGLVGLYMLLLQCKPSYGVRVTWLIIIVLASLLQAGLTILEFAFHFGLSGGRPVGSFLQANVLGSFLATGLACTLWLNLFSNGWYNKQLIKIALFILPMTLILVQSRAADIGSVFAAFILLWKATRSGKSIYPSVILIFSGVLAGVLWLYIGHMIYPESILSPVSKSGSNSARLYMLKSTFHIIMKHPLLGNGYGGFEALFGQQAQFHLPGLEAATVTHPHNELLYAWVEGGVIAVLGLILIFAYFLYQMWTPAGMRLPGIALLLPISIHMCLEFPLYLSATHGLVLVMLLVVIGPTSNNTDYYNHDVLPVKFSIRRLILGGISALVIIYMVTGIISQQRLMRIESERFMPLIENEDTTLEHLPNQSAILSRLDFDRHIALLLRFNEEHNPILLKRYWFWGKQYLRTHNDPNVWHSLIMIAKIYHPSAVPTLCAQAHGRWPHDIRFTCSP